MGMRAFIAAKIVISFDLRKSLRAKTRGFRNYDEQTSAKNEARLRAFCMETECVLYQNGGRFVWKRNAFCIKTSSILGQNALHFGSKRTLFWAKTPRLQF
jgi:hypothetical protein